MRLSAKDEHDLKAQIHPRPATSRRDFSIALFDEAWAAVHAKANALIESRSDEELEALLRRELMEIASFNGLDGKIVQKILSDSARNRARAC